MSSHEHDDDEADATRAEGQREDTTAPTVAAEGALTGGPPPPEPPLGDDVAPAPEVGSGEWAEEGAVEGAGVDDEHALDEELPWAPEAEVPSWDDEAYEGADEVEAGPGIHTSSTPAAPATPGGHGAGGDGPPGDPGGAGRGATRRRGAAPARSRGPAARRSTNTSRPGRAPEAGPHAAAPQAAAPANRWMILLLSALTVAVIALTVYAISLGRRDDDRAASPVTTTATTTRPAPATLPPGAFTTFRDDETGFSIRYPSSWERFEAPLREIRLLVGAGPHSVRIRSRRTEVPTTPQNLSNLKAFADGAIAGPTTVVLQQESVTVNGLIGFRYLYTFTDPDSGIEGAHLHYFLFQGHKMHDLIFQALPTDAFAEAEAIFNQMLESFRSDPEPPTASGTAPSPGG